MKESHPQLIRFLLPILVLCFAAAPDLGFSQAFTTTRLADGFDFPVGKPGSYGKDASVIPGYYIFRGFTQNGHLGEDWNGNGGGNTDLGDPVYSIANGVVVFSQDYKKGWGNVTIIRHAYRERSGQIAFVDSLYGHLNVRQTKVGDRVVRGQKIGTIGRGPHNMYLAHLHFEIRKDLRVGMRRELYPKTYKTYVAGGPKTFLRANRVKRYESRMVRVPINTFQKSSVANRAYSQDILPPKIASQPPTGPAVPQTISSVISEETDRNNASPTATRNMLNSLLGGPAAWKPKAKIPLPNQGGL